MKNALLFLTPTLIWGSTWYVIKFQVGDVDPMFSVAYRFCIAGALMLAIAKLWKLKLAFTRKEHAFILLQGLFLFGFNYWLVYLSELHLTSGLVGLIFSLLVFFNIANSRVFLKTPIQVPVIVGAFFGLVGTALIFWKDLSTFSLDDSKLLGMLFALTGTLVASWGNITSARNQQAGIPVISSNAFGMTYGGVAMLLLGLISGKELSFIVSTPYIVSLLYLSVFGSIIAFGAYLTLIGNIGAGKAAYVGVIAPVIALLISTVMEDYHWTNFSISGAGLILIGNVIALSRKKKRTEMPRNPEQTVPVDTLEKHLPDQLTD